MNTYALDYKEKKCTIEGKEISYKEIILYYDNISVKVTVPKDVKNQVVLAIDDGDCDLRIDYDHDKSSYILLLRFYDFIFPLNNKIFSDLELYVLNNYKREK